MTEGSGEADSRMLAPGRQWTWLLAKVLLAFGAAYGVTVVLGAWLDGSLRADGSTAVDADITRWFVDHRSAALNTWWKSVTWLGSSVVVIPVVVIVTVLLLRQRERLLAGYVIVAAAGGAFLNVLAKTTVGRHRPPSSVSLQHPSGSSFPSGHTTQAAATCLALAVVVIVLTRSRKWRIGAWIVALSVTALVGLSRVYLGVHWATDVLGGWFLGALWVTGVTLVLIPESRGKEATTDPDVARDPSSAIRPRT